MAMLRGMESSVDVARAYRDDTCTQCLDVARPENDRTDRRPAFAAPRRLLQSLMNCDASPPRRRSTMRSDHPDRDTDLHVPEPLRIAFAIGALLLGLIAALHT
jgi:hypothetical protein